VITLPIVPKIGRATPDYFAVGIAMLRVLEYSSRRSAALETF
jgi:hypothetical protein